jgi:hypothetical protein
MKYFSFVLISSVLFLSACKKSNDEVVVNDGLIGKWQLIKSGIGIGGGGTFQDADPAKPEIIEFKRDSTFTANVNSYYLKTYNAYSLITSDEIKFLPALILYQNFSYKVINGTYLKIYMPCIEACILEYKSVK